MLKITANASKRIKQVLDQKENKGKKFRVFVSGGGCAGLRYGMMIDNDKRESDREIKNNGIRILIDEKSAEVLDGAELDYVESLEASGFKINNPGMIYTCGCGHSFTTRNKTAMEKIEKCH